MREKIRITRVNVSYFLTDDVFTGKFQFVFTFSMAGPEFPTGVAPTYYYRPQTKLQEGNVSTGICYSGHGGRLGNITCIMGYVTW